MKFLAGTALAVLLLAPHANAQKPADTKSKRSYSIGQQIGKNLSSDFKENGVEIDPRWVARGLLDAFGGKNQLTDKEIQTVLMDLQKEIQKKAREILDARIKKGKDFLAANGKKAGVTTTKSGLQYSVIKAGNGAKPTAKDTVKVHYHGTLIDGTVFDSSVQRGKPATFGVTQVIPGWVEALQLMPAGSKWKLYIPANLAYGFRPRPKIPAGSVLVFEVELLEILKP